MIIGKEIILKVVTNRHHCSKSEASECWETKTSQFHEYELVTILFFLLQVSFLVRSDDVYDTMNKAFCKSSNSECG